MTDEGDHIGWAAEAVAVFQKHSRSGDEHAIADLICDLGHLADDLGFDFLSEVKRGIGYWYAEQHHLGARPGRGSRNHHQAEVSSDRQVAGLRGLCDEPCRAE
jgi:hypothetical protein